MAETDDFDEPITPDASEIHPRKPRAKLPDATEAEELAQERTLAALTTHPGWELYAEMVRQDIIDLRTLKGAKITGKTREEVGEMYLIANEAAARIEARFNHVEAVAQGVHDRQESDNEA